MENLQENQNDNENQIASSVAGANGSGISAALALAVYDKNARQVFVVEGEDNENDYKLTFAVENMDDEHLFEYDRLQETQVTQDGKNQLFQTNTLAASRYFFNNHLQLIDGFDGDLPANWRDDFTDDEKQSVVDALLDSDVYVADEVKTLGKRKFGVKKEDAIQIKAVFNGAETLLNFKFPPKDNQQIAKFRKITVGAIFKKGRTGRFLRPSWRELCEFYDELGVTCDGDPAAHLKVLAMRERFDAVLQKQTKKPNS